jgi:hypothetical protein
MSLAVNVLCRDPHADRVIPRFARYLRDCLGWSLTARPDPAADVYYLSGYFEHELLRGAPDRPVAAYFTHLETEPPGNAKAALFRRMAGQVDLRVATAAMYVDLLTSYGPTAQIAPPVERGRFTVPPARKGRMTAGFSGYTYGNGRKGEGMAKAIIGSKPGRSCEWKASGRGWPVPTRMYPWAEMPAFYQSLDVLVVTATVEGVPMPPLEALSCGVSVVVPRGVGLLDELASIPGIHRYQTGSSEDCVRALGEALAMRPDVDRQALREATGAYTITAWCEQHRQAFEEVFLWQRAASIV